MSRAGDRGPGTGDWSKPLPEAPRPAGTTSRPAAAALRDFPHCGMPELPLPHHRAAENRSHASPPLPP